MTPVSDGRGHIKGIALLLLSLANWEPQAQLRISRPVWSVARDPPRQLCNALIRLVRNEKTHSHLSISHHINGSIKKYIYHEIDSHFKVPSTARDSLCSACYATPTLYMQITKSSDSQPSPSRCHGDSER